VACYALRLLELRSSRWLWTTYLIIAAELCVSLWPFLFSYPGTRAKPLATYHGTYHALSPKRSTKSPWAFFSRPLIRGEYTICSGVFIVIEWRCKGVLGFANICDPSTTQVRGLPAPWSVTGSPGYRLPRLPAPWAGVPSSSLGRITTNWQLVDNSQTRLSLAGHCRWRPPAPYQFGHPVQTGSSWTYEGGGACL
jgi:hypothetical protein